MAKNQRMSSSSRISLAALVAAITVATSPCLAAGTSQYEWTPLDTLERATTPEGVVTFTYDGDGQRLTKTTPEDEVVYIRDAAGNVLAEYDGDGNLLVEYVYLGARRIARVSSANTRHYYHADHVGTALAITDENGNEVWRGENLPFGTEVRSSGEPDDDRKFTGKELDDATGLHYFGARYYDSRAGRFVSVDPANRGYLGTPQRWNRYHYGLNNPLSYTDPLGRDALAVTFQGYMVEIPAKTVSLRGRTFTVPGTGRTAALGHSAIIVSDETGFTTYSEFGRYGPSASGRVQRPFSIPNFQLDENGVPTRASLKRVLRSISERRQGRPVEGAYFVNDDSESMLRFVHERLADSSLQGEYSFYSNNCATYCEDVLRAGGEELDLSIINNPDNVIQELQDRADFRVRYDPKSQRLTVVCSGDICPE